MDLPCYIPVYTQGLSSELTKSNSNWHSSHIELLIPFPVSLIDPYRRCRRKLRLLSDSRFPSLSPSSSNILLLLLARVNRIFESMTWVSSVDVVPTCSHRFPWPHIILIRSQRSRFSWESFWIRQGGLRRNNSFSHLASLLRKFWSTCQCKHSSMSPIKIMKSAWV